MFPTIALQILIFFSLASLTRFEILVGESKILKQSCIPRDYGRGSIVCVCNSTYCDGSLPLDILSSSSYKKKQQIQVWTTTKTGIRLHKSRISFTKSTNTITPTRIYDQSDNQISPQGVVNDIVTRDIVNGESSRLPGTIGSILTTILGFTSTGSNTKKIVASDISQGILKIRHKEKFQEILGLGGSFTDSTGHNIKKLSVPTQEMLMKSYFGPDGSDYSIGRVPMGGSDFSLRPYTYDDTLNKKPDFNLTRFALQPEDFKFKLPLIKMATALRGGNPVRLIASPWSAPVWMKTNNRLNGAGVLQRKFYQLWADYYIKFIEAYNQVGISIWGLTTGNEPMNGFVPGFPFNCMGWTPGDASTWIGEYLGPTLKNKFGNKFPKIIMMDDNKIFLRLWSQTVLDPNQSSANFIDGVGTHWYFDFLVSEKSLNEFHVKFPHHFIIQTEACLGFLPWELEKVSLGNWERAETYLEAIINDMNNWVGGWIDWNLALDLEGGPNWAGWRADAAILVDSTNDEFLKQPIYYGIAHVSKFVPPGSIRIGLDLKINDESIGSNFKSIAFLRPDNGTVLILLNKATNPLLLELKDKTNGRLKIEIPSKAMQTLVWW